MQINDLMNENEYLTFLKNLKKFTDKQNYYSCDFILIELTLDKLPNIIFDKIFSLKNDNSFSIEKLLKKDEYEYFVNFTEKLTKFYHKRMSIVSSKCLIEPLSANIFYKEFTYKKDFATAILNLRKSDLEDIKNLNGPILLNIEAIASILSINLESFEIVIDTSIEKWFNLNN